MARFHYCWQPFIAGMLMYVGGCAAFEPAPTRPLTVTGPIQAGDEVTVRGQSPGFAIDSAPGGYPRTGQPVSGGPIQPGPGGALPPYPLLPGANGAYGQPASSPGGPIRAYQPAQPPAVSIPSAGPATTGLPGPPADSMPGMSGISPFSPNYPGFQPPSVLPQENPAIPTPLDVFVEEARTGQFMFGVTVNSNAGLLGQITVNERNFDIFKPPTSWDDFLNGTAWRGGGQNLRIQAQPGTVLQSYLISIADPYFLGSDFSFDASGFYFNRLYFDWTEQRVGGRLSWGRRLTPDLSIVGALRAENIDIINPRVRGVPELEAVLGHNSIYSGRVTLTHDTRDIPFMPTQGRLIQAAFEQAFGDFSFPRGDFEYSEYFPVRSRPDGTGRHTVAFTSKLGISGSDTPIFENYFAGGFSTLRGFYFRGASPLDGGVRVGGRFQWLNNLEYFFPLTADDMIRGTIFCDFGTIERSVGIHSDQFRVAPGFGLRINVPALGPAPLAFDFAFPVAHAAGDQRQMFSFFFGATR